VRLSHGSRHSGNGVKGVKRSLRNGYHEAMQRTLSALCEAARTQRSIPELALSARDHVMRRVLQSTPYFILKHVCDVFTVE
jgi:hypothetical protein